MTTERQNVEFPEQADDNRRIWDANARWWDDRIGDGNDFQRLLIEPATERLLNVVAGDTILDAACGAGRFARRMAELGARVVAFDYSAEFIARARERTPADTAVEYHLVDAANVEALVALGSSRFNKAVCTMALMDMPEIGPLVAALSRMLAPGGVFVFSVTHPCFSDGRARASPPRRQHLRVSLGVLTVPGRPVDRDHVDEPRRCRLGRDRARRLSPVPARVHKPVVGRAAH